MTDWEKSSDWYKGCVGDKGHHYHQTVVIPGILRLLGIDAKGVGSLLDLGCGTGVLKKHLPRGIEYVGVDLAPSLVKQVGEGGCVADATKPLPVKKHDFDFVTIVLALQNMEKGEGAVENGRLHLKKGGKLLIVLNHPCFRIPRQSAWGIDEKSEVQYRRVDRYLSDMKIPIQTNPSKKEKSDVTYSYHHPLSHYVAWLVKAGFAVTGLEEWASDKMSEGGKARRENRARKEIPLFLALLSEKKEH